MKPGYKTTEFWLTAVAMIVGLLASSGAIVEGSQLAQALGVAGTILAAMGYSHGRSIVKKGQ